MTALPLQPHTEAEEATLARFEGAEPAPESLRERVTRAIADADYDQATGGLMDWLDLDEAEQDHFRRLADAAIDVMRGQR